MKAVLLHLRRQYRIRLPNLRTSELEDYPRPAPALKQNRKSKEEGNRKRCGRFSSEMDTGCLTSQQERRRSGRSDSETRSIPAAQRSRKWNGKMAIAFPCAIPSPFRTPCLSSTASALKSFGFSLRRTTLRRLPYDAATFASIAVMNIPLSKIHFCHSSILYNAAG